MIGCRQQSFVIKSLKCYWHLPKERTILQSPLAALTCLESILLYVAVYVYVYMYLPVFVRVYQYSSVIHKDIKISTSNPLGIPWESATWNLFISSWQLSVSISVMTFPCMYYFTTWLYFLYKNKLVSWFLSPGLKF